MCPEYPLCYCPDHTDTDPGWGPFLAYWAVLVGIVILVVLAAVTST